MTTAAKDERMQLCDSEDVSARYGQKDQRSAATGYQITIVMFPLKRCRTTVLLPPVALLPIFRYNVCVNAFRNVTNSCDQGIGDVDEDYCEDCGFFSVSLRVETASLCHMVSG